MPLTCCKRLPKHTFHSKLLLATMSKYFYFTKTLCFFLFLHVLPRTPTTITAAAADLILLNCGASANLSDASGRTWDGDDHSAASGISSASAASNMDPSVPRVPFETARFFLSPFTFTFTLQTPGPKFLRLYFYPAIYSNFNTSFSRFSVSANSFLLLGNFTGAPSPSPPSLTKEFLINVDGDRKLELSFSPNPKSFAFINGIEIVSVPDQLFHLNKNILLENLYRLNIGGGEVEIQDDSGMFRAWFDDDDYTNGEDFGRKLRAENLQISYTAQTPPYSAPAAVYRSSRTAKDDKSLDWRFAVDSGNYFLLRLHFCEIQTDVTEQKQRVFMVTINKQTVEKEADVVLWSGGNGIPVFRDYVTRVGDDGVRGKQQLLLSLTANPDGNSKYNSAMLNGLEIFRLKYLNMSVEFGEDRETRPLLIYAVVGSAIRLFAMVAAASFLILKLKKRKGKGNGNGKAAAESKRKTSGLCRYFSLDEIKMATHNFDGGYVIGKGGFGDVYKGLVDGGATVVAIKRLNPSSNQGANEFLTEIKMLSNVRHLHLVSLIGYCDEQGEMILVYDYMANGTLHDHLHNSEDSPPTWKQRLRICIGAARGLHYLHTGTKQAIIHRDVKSTNILLDEQRVAKISDFGLSKMGPSNESFTHISTNVKGTFGYMDPEYFSTSKLTRSSDVYAFGVVLFEVLSRRGAVDMRLEEEKHSLAGWARHCIEDGKLDRLIDSSLMGQISTECIESFVGIAGRCLHTRAHQRPSMGDVVKGLEIAMALQHSNGPTEQVLLVEAENDL